MTVPDDLNRRVHAFLDLHTLGHPDHTEAEVAWASLLKRGYEDDVESVTGLVAHGHRNHETRFGVSVVDLDRASADGPCRALGRRVGIAAARESVLCVVVAAARGWVKEIEVRGCERDDGKNYR